MKRLLIAWGWTIAMVAGLAFVPNFEWFFAIIFWFGAIMVFIVLIFWDKILEDYENLLKDPPSICPRWLDNIFDIIIAGVLIYIGHPVYAAFYIIFFMIITGILGKQKIEAIAEHKSKQKLGTSILDSASKDDSDCPKCDGWGKIHIYQQNEENCPVCNGSGQFTLEKDKN